MPSSTEILNSIQTSGSGLMLTELLARHPDIARRTAQRLIAKLIESGQITASGEGRARRYFGAAAPTDASTLDTNTDSFPSFIPLSADSRDILAYINQPTEARKPIGYPCQDPLLHLGVDPADATVTQRDRLRKGALPDIPIDGRSGQTGRVDDLFQADNSHKQISLVSLREIKGFGPVSLVGLACHACTRNRFGFDLDERLKVHILQSDCVKPYKSCFRSESPETLI